MERKIVMIIAATAEVKVGKIKLRKNYTSEAFPDEER